MKKSDGSLTEGSGALVECVEYYLLVENSIVKSQHTIEEAVAKIQKMESLIVHHENKKSKAGDSFMFSLFMRYSEACNDHDIFFSHFTCTDIWPVWMLLKCS